MVLKRFCFLRMRAQYPVLLSAVLVVLLVSGCDAFSGSSTPGPRGRLVGEWVIERQTGTYFIETDAMQTVLDPDAAAPGSMALLGVWSDFDTPDRVLDEPLRYARHTARPVYQGHGPGLLLSTKPIQTLETVGSGEDNGFAVRLSDVYHRQQNTFKPDGFLEGIIETSYYQQYPGRLEVASETLSSDPLPTVPLTARPTISLDSLPFAPKFTGADTAYVAGTLQPRVQTIPVGVETPVDTERTPSNDLERQQITYRFTEDDSVYVSATVNGDTLRIEGEWATRHDTLRIWQETDTTTALIDFQPGVGGPASELRMTFNDPLCAEGDDDCRTFYEHTFGLEPGVLRGGTWRQINHLIPGASTAAAKRDARSSTNHPAVCTGTDAVPPLCTRHHLLQGGAPQLRPSTELR